ncbi:hypothetical protein E8E13_002480 [Curvularia kusanoi]|uniref:Uncharacterized protein n=1 Tax=Curvularia kusanoi TaxID=90978 RepID=A0A9P4T9J5_CURKU|nr:hypothetical protein E8E13_002480 [Curvularia kusanoi]
MATQQDIVFQGQLIRNLKLRSQANQERLQSEIALAYNRIAQRDSKVMLEISAATKSDSKAMKTVALVTMVFLPATFTSAVFSMSFFNFSPETGNWTVSREFWVYWVVAIPLTGLTLLFWLFFLQEPGARPALTLARISEWRRKKSLNGWKP